MLNIEFLKITKRKFNYIYFMIIALILGSFSYKSDYFTNYLEINITEYLYEHLFKQLLIYTMIILGVNLILSYREDYKQKVNSIILYSKVSKFGNLFAKFIMTTIIFLLFYFLQVALIYGQFYFRKIITIGYLVGNISLLYYFMTISSMLVFTSALVLFMISLFNNTNLAVSLSVLFFIGSKYLVSYAEGLHDIFKYLKYSFVDIYNVAISYLSMTTLNKDLLMTSIILLANTVLLFVLSYILKLIKQK